MNLSPEQQKILEYTGNMIVISNPGTGKTTTLALKVVKLLEDGVLPEKILCITFTEKAKKEMFDAIYEYAHGKFSDTQIMKINIYTFHSFTYNYLIDAGVISGNIVGNNLMRFSILKSFVKNKAFHYSKDYIISDIVPKTENAIRYIKSFGLLPDKINANEVKNFIEQIYESKKTSYSLEELKAFADYFIKAYKDYEASKKETIDYSDMLLFFMKNFKGEKFDYVLVDEMQDMNEIEAKIAEMVGKTIILVGDAKQAIFGFQGGSTKNFKKFMNICEPKMLSTNRRSCQQILDYSKNHFLNNSKNKEMFREELELFKSGMGGKKPKVIVTKAHFTRVLDIIQSNPEKTIGIITRTNRQLIELSQYLDLSNISYSSTSSQATTQQARNEIITFLKGILSDAKEEKIASLFTIFSPYTLKEAFEISEMNKSRKPIEQRLKKLEEMCSNLKKKDIDDLFNKIILPLCVSKGNEWFSTGLIVKSQLDEYISLEQTPLKDEMIDFLNTTEESYMEKAIDSRITLTTVHKAKGLGFDIVVYMPSSSSARTSFVDIMVEAVLGSNNIEVKDEIEEESLRIDFVAFTRAKERLFVLADDKNKGNYHIEDFSELEADEKEDELIATKMDSRLSEAFSLFVSGRMDESKKLLEKEDSWMRQFIVNYFKKLDKFSYSMVKTDPYEFLMDNIIAMPRLFEATTFGSEVHAALANVFSGKQMQLEGDVKKAVDNGMDAITHLKKEFPGLTQLYSEKRLEVPLNSITKCDDGKSTFKGFIDAAFKHNAGYIIIDWKTDKNTNAASEHKRQLSVYRKILSIMEGIPEDKINIFVIFIALRGEINTGRFDTETEGEKRDQYKTFEKHLQQILDWRASPETFIQAFLEADKDDALYQVIKDKLSI